jgi:hypothetical protein
LDQRSLRPPQRDAAASLKLYLLDQRRDWRASSFGRCRILLLLQLACTMGLEGIVSKRLDRAYGAGKCKHWVKVKNPAHPAYSRVRDALIRARQSM